MVSLIYNPNAGGGRVRRRLGVVLEALRADGLAVEPERTESLEHARTLATTAVERDALPVAFGGDGLIAAVAEATSATGSVIGVLPGGRGNDFARSLGISLDPVTACETISSGRVGAVDLGIVGDSTFLTIATSGFDSEANRIANQTRLRFGSLDYAYGGLRALAAWDPLEFDVRLDGEPIRFTGYSVAAANTPSYGGGMRVAPHAQIADGMLDVVMVGAAPKAAFLRQLPRVYRGAHIHNEFVCVRRASRVEITAARPTVMYADGDPLTTLPVSVGVLPQALRVMVPR